MEFVELSVPLISMASILQGYVWICMDMYGHVWGCMGMYGCMDVRMLCVCACGGTFFLPST